jgi:NADH-ubiquinone oxidoreductase chain 6
VPWLGAVGQATVPPFDCRRSPFGCVATAGRATVVLRLQCQPGCLASGCWKLLTAERPELPGSQVARLAAPLLRSRGAWRSAAWLDSNIKYLINPIKIKKYIQNTKTWAINFLFLYTMTTILINILAFATLLSGVFSITSKNPVISVVFLIGTFVLSAGYLILIGINFVGISYIIVYVGAIAVLFLFVIMMINIKLTDILETGSQYTKTLPLALAVGYLFIYIIFSIIKFNFNNVPVLSIILDKITFFNEMFSNSYTVIKMNLVNSIVNNFYYSSWPGHSDSLITIFQQIEALGHNLYTYGAVLLITLSIILLLAMFATIVISRSNGE